MPLDLESKYLNILMKEPKDDIVNGNAFLI